MAREAGKEEDSVEEWMKVLRMKKLHQLTDYWKQMVHEGNGYPEHIWHQQLQGCQTPGCPKRTCESYRPCDRGGKDLAA